MFNKQLLFILVEVRPGHSHFTGQTKQYSTPDLYFPYPDVNVSRVID